MSSLVMPSCLFYCEVEVVKQTDEWKGGADSDEEQVQPGFVFEFLWRLL